MGATNANSFPDGQRGRTRTGDTARVADYAASTLPVRGPGVVGRRFPQGSTVSTLPARRRGGTSMPKLPLTIVPATAPDSEGTPHPDRVRVYGAFLGNLRPAEMPIPDAVLADGTDNHCYLTMEDGVNYVYGKVLVDAATGLHSAAHVYRVASEEEPDGTFAYLLIGTVVYDAAATPPTLSIEQVTTGNQSLVVLFTPDGAGGTTIQPFWVPNSAS